MTAWVWQKCTSGQSQISKLVRPYLERVHYCTLLSMHLDFVYYNKRVQEDHKGEEMESSTKFEPPQHRCLAPIWWLLWRWPSLTDDDWKKAPRALFPLCSHWSSVLLCTTSSSRIPAAAQARSSRLLALKSLEGLICVLKDISEG